MFCCHSLGKVCSRSGSNYKAWGHGMNFVVTYLIYTLLSSVISVALAQGWNKQWAFLALG